MPPASDRAVFLSYASQDAVAARRICEALRASGVMVWFDQSELVGGDAWDQKIRRQLKECAIFMPIISANTQARAEGYFRVEWRLADRRTEAMGKSKSFLVPISIDDTRDSNADVPDSFLAVQWTRLPGGETNAAFCERVRTLLSSSDVARVSRPVTLENTGQETRATPKVSRRIPTPAWIAGAAAAASGAVLIVVLRPERNAGAGTRPPTSEKSTAPLTEARQLVARAWAAIESTPEPRRAELDLATEYCKRAAELDRMDPEVWAAWSQVDTWYVALNLDFSQERRESARAKATQAMSLAPNSYEARLAQACYLVRGEGFNAVSTFAAEAEQRLRELLREKPDEPRALLALGHILRNIGKSDEGAAIFDRLALDPAWTATASNGKGWLLYFAGRMDEAGAVAAQSVAVQPFYGNLLLQIRVAMYWQGDLELAKTALDRMPAVDLREDPASLAAVEIHWWRRDHSQILRVLNAVPRVWLRSGSGSAPKDYFVGLAHQMAGNVDAAKLAWRAALRLVEERLTGDPNTATLQFQKGQLLALLGERLAAEVAFELARQLGLKGWNATVGIPLLLGDAERAITGLEQSLSVSGAPMRFALPVASSPAVGTASPSLSWASLRFSPHYDPLRANPRFQALLAAADKDPKRSPHAKAPSMANTEGNPPDQKSVAVLAFKSIGEDKEGEIFSEGISEELLNVLGTVPGLRVAARASAFYFKDKNATTQEMGQKLNVAYLVDGSVQRVGTAARVNARLSRADTGELIWSRKFEGELKNIFALQDEIAGRIADNLKLKLGSAARAPKAVNPEAYVLLLEGRYFWNLRSTDGFDRAETAIAKAIALDPEFAPAHAALADVFTIRSTYALQDGRIERTLPEVIARARTEALRAIELDPSLPDAYPALAYCLLLEMRFAEAEHQFQKALALNPNSTVAHAWYATLLLSQGRLDLGMLEYEKSSALDPLWAVNLTTHVEALNYSRRFDDALRMADRTRALRPDYVPNLGNRARALFKVGRAAEAIETARLIRTQLDKDPRRDADSSAIWILCQAGLREEAGAYAEELFKKLPESSQQRGFVFGALGQFDKALPYLERTPPVVRRRLYWDPMWEEWRDDPRFQQLMVKLGCVEEYKVARETLARMLKDQVPAK